MSFKDAAVAMALMATLAMPAPAWAFGGGGAGGGCAGLPEYYRARGALQGMTSACDMSIEQARRIVAAQDGAAAVEQPVAQAPQRHYRVRSPQP